MSRYTPGPWLVGNSNLTNGYESDDIVSEDGLIIGHVYSNKGLSIDARLIAAAPEMLEASKTTVEAITAIAFSNPHSPSAYLEALNLLKQTIAKAEGATQ